ncbi:penicillin-binding protein [Dysgonomonas sp. BGC7]|uniref:penicillin-binding protein n=1 Tax=Dysgonomonas sp. BGC7 TaxID=1658008 RepID=UPI0006800AF1|nr:penicillin-binding transpeptidase domain-containing protein [Dysgonomonas sp. BGC7]MBD8387315.1 transpeptidase family protein [Dysgonomonas sp. BGC7]
MAKKSEGAMKNVAVSRYGWLVFLLSMIFIAVIVCIFKIKYAEGSAWRELGRQETVKKDREIRPNRGNIYADDDRLLATSEPLYGVYIDFMSEGIAKDTLMKYVTPLSQSLAKKFPDRNAAQYKKVIMDGWQLSRKELAEIERNRKNGSNKKVKVRSRYVRIIRPDINYIDLKEIKTYPFLNQRSNRSGLFTEEKTMRMKPFGRLAGRTVGSIFKDFEAGGASGLELKYDSILKGIPGVKTRQRVQGRWIDVVLEEPVDGLDIKTTLNVDVQDLAERALYSKLAETKAESGVAIVMEVETGEIKAITNLDRISEGVYAEGNPNAFSYMSEPGSTFKTVSLMVALEDGVITPNDSVYVGNGLFEYKGRTVRDHYWRTGGRKDYMTIAEGMHISSNVVISKMILKGYENDPQKYVKHIHDLGITKKIEWDVPLKGKEGTSVIRFPDDKFNIWSKTTLPWMSFGYETQIPPIYMLMFYNGIANNGKMIKPFLTKAFMKDGKIKEEFETEVINPSLCSDKTLSEIQEILRGVVTNGTGKAVSSDLFPIAGKTGTAMIAARGGYEGYYVSFCGYFPADKPKYTCFVGIRRPVGSPSGGLMPGAVFKNIAEGIFNRNLVSTPVKASKDTVNSLIPAVKSGSLKNTELVLKKLDQSYSLLEKVDWIKAKQDSLDNKILLENNVTIKQGFVPSVIGMGARDAIYLLENAGLKVNLSGAGKVKRQSITAGSKVIKGSTISIELN